VGCAFHSAAATPAGDFGFNDHRFSARAFSECSGCCRFRPHRRVQLSSILVAIFLGMYSMHGKLLKSVLIVQLDFREVGDLLQIHSVHIKDSS